MYLTSCFNGLFEEFTITKSLALKLSNIAAKLDNLQK